MTGLSPSCETKLRRHYYSCDHYTCNTPIITINVVTMLPFPLFLFLFPIVTLIVLLWLLLWLWYCLLVSRNVDAIDDESEDDRVTIHDPAFTPLKRQIWWIYRGICLIGEHTTTTINPYYITTGTLLPYLWTQNKFYLMQSPTLDPSYLLLLLLLFWWWWSAMTISLMYFIVNRGKSLSGLSRDEHTLLLLLLSLWLWWGWSAMTISLMYFIVNRGKSLSGLSRDEHTLPSYWAGHHYHRVHFITLSIHFCPSVRLVLISACCCCC